MNIKSFLSNNIYYNRYGFGPQTNKVWFGMREDIYAKQRNGHLLIDTFDRTSNTLDIRSNGLYPSNVLSNLAHNEFEYDGVKCSSLEGFLQSLKTSDEVKQQEICLMYGGSAKKNGQKFMHWKENGKLYWKGKEYKRDSEEFYELVLGAYKACYQQNDIFKTALNSTMGKKLTHSSGKNDKTDTILTREEFVHFLEQIRGT